MTETIQTERIPLASIYKHDGFVNIDFEYDANQGFELFGFLKCLVNKMEKDLTEDMEIK